MVCSNCKSTDIVSIQGRDFCINCGQRVEKKPAQASSAAPVIKLAKPTPVKPARKPAVKAAKPLPAPKAAPKAAVVAQEVPQIKIRTKPKPVAEPPRNKPVINHPTVSAPRITVKTAQSKADGVADLPARSSSKTAPLDLRSDERRKILEARQSMLSKSKKPVGRLSDVRVARSLPKPVVSPVITKEPTKSLPETAQEGSAEVISASTPAKPVFSGEGSALVFAWKQLGNWRYLVLGLLSTLSATIPSLIWRLNVDTVKLNDIITAGPHGLIGTDLLTNAVRFGAIAAGLVVPVYLIRVWAANAVTYAAAKSSDNRNTKWQTWAKASFGSLWTVVKLDLALMVPWLLVAGAEAGLVATLGYGNFGFVTRATGLIVGNAILIYLALGLIFTRLLGGYAVILANLDAKEALALGWRLYRKRTLALAVCGLIGGGMSAIIYLPASALNYANRDLSTEVSGLGQVLGAAGFTAFLSALAFVFVTTYFFKQYRRSVLAAYGHSKPNLLSGAQPRRVPLIAKLALLTLVVLSAVVATVGYSTPGSVRPTVEQAIRQVDPS